MSFAKALGLNYLTAPTVWATGLTKVTSGTFDFRRASALPRCSRGRRRTKSRKGPDGPGGWWLRVTGGTTCSANASYGRPVCGSLVVTSVTWTCMLLISTVGMVPRIWPRASWTLARIWSAMGMIGSG